MEVTLFLLSIVPCFALVMGQTPVAPMDAASTCRTSFNFRAAHDWIPYVNDTSDGVRGEVKWQVLLDQFDYENLLGSDLVPPSPWEARNVDGDNVQFTVGSGGNCQYTIRVSGRSYENANSNNWVFTQSVNLMDAIEIYVNATIRLTGCHQRASENPPCQKNFFTLNTYNTNSPQTVAQRTNPNTYQPYLGGDRIRSRLEQNAGDSGRILMIYRRPQGFSFTHFGIQDTGTFGVVERFLVYYKVAQGYEDGLVVCPSVALPAMGSGEVNTESCTCKANSTPTANLVRTCDESGVCQESPACECNPGYEYNSTRRMCIGCGMGTYKTTLSNTARCIPCPGNSMTINSSSTVCDCVRGTVRCPSRPDDACQLFDDFFRDGEINCETSSQDDGSDGLNQATTDTSQIPQLSCDDCLITSAVLGGVLGLSVILNIILIIMVTKNRATFPSQLVPPTSAMNKRGGNQGTLDIELKPNSLYGLTSEGIVIKPNEVCGASVPGEPNQPATYECIREPAESSQPATYM